MYKKHHHHHRFRPPLVNHYIHGYLSHILLHFQLSGHYAQHHHSFTPRQRITQYIISLTISAKSPHPFHHNPINNHNDTHTPHNSTPHTPSSPTTILPLPPFFTTAYQTALNKILPNENIFLPTTLSTIILRTTLIQRSHQLLSRYLITIHHRPKLEILPSMTQSSWHIHPFHITTIVYQRQHSRYLP